MRTGNCSAGRGPLRRPKTVGDADIKDLPAFGHLKKLRIAGGEVTNAGVGRLATIRTLTDLALLGSQIDNDGLGRFMLAAQLDRVEHPGQRERDRCRTQHLKRLGKLFSLGLGDNAFSDRAIDRLLPLAGLKTLDLRGCSQITDKGLRRLQALGHLRGLKLGGFAITDDTLALVAGFPQLTALTWKIAGRATPAWKIPKPADRRFHRFPLL